MSKRSLKRAILAAKKVTSQEPMPQRFRSFSAHLEDWEKSGAPTSGQTYASMAEKRRHEALIDQLAKDGLIGDLS